jgi:hypothetical protein
MEEINLDFQKKILNMKTKILGSSKFFDLLVGQEKIIF